MIPLLVNGVEYQVEEGLRTLLDCLREDLALVGTKEGCGIGICGACTVLIDGRPVSSCLLLADQATGKEIQTIEGLADGEKLHPVQRAFIDHAAFQCAFCTPGFVLSGVALWNSADKLSEEEIRDYLAGNLCRCGSYENIMAGLRSVLGE